MGDFVKEFFVVNIDIMRNGFLFFYSQQQMFCEVIIDFEIKNVFFDIDDFKVLGMDGFNVCFFKKVWDIIYYDICEVVREFFKNCVLLKVFNYIVIIFIFKSN